MDRKPYASSENDKWTRRGINAASGATALAGVSSGIVFIDIAVDNAMSFIDTPTKALNEVSLQESSEFIDSIRVDTGSVLMSEYNDVIIEWAPIGEFPTEVLPTGIAMDKTDRRPTEASPPHDTRIEERKYVGAAIHDTRIKEQPRGEAAIHVLGPIGPVGWNEASNEERLFSDAEGRGYQIMESVQAKFEWETE